MIFPGVQTYVEMSNELLSIHNKHLVWNGKPDSKEEKKVVIIYPGGSMNVPVSGVGCYFLHLDLCRFFGRQMWEAKSKNPS